MRVPFLHASCDFYHQPLKNNSPYNCLSCSISFEAFVEPETLVNEMSVVLVDVTGDFTRRNIGGPKGIDVIAKELDVPIYDVEETGYPPRMRQKIERDRLLKKREEQRKRREKFERGET